MGCKYKIEELDLDDDLEPRKFKGMTKRGNKSIKNLARNKKLILKRRYR